MPRFILIVIALLLTASCTPDSNIATFEPAKTNQPSELPTPDFLVDISYRNLGDECIAINQSKIWEAGNSARELEDHLYNSTRLIIDGGAIVLGKESIREFHLAGIHILDSQGNILGSTGGYMLVCVAIEQLTKGTHTATIEFNSLSGKPYSYSWSFSVN